MEVGKINELGEKSALQIRPGPVRPAGSGAQVGEQVYGGDAQAFRQHAAESRRQRGPCGIGLRDAAQTNLSLGLRRQDDVVTLNAGEFLGGPSGTGAS